jgi:hypothetical protein
MSLIGKVVHVGFSFVNDALLVRYPDDTHEDAKLELLGRSPVLAKAVTSTRSTEVALEVPSGFAQSWLRCARMTSQQLRKCLETSSLAELVLSLKVPFMQDVVCVPGFSGSLICFSTSLWFKCFKKTSVGQHCALGFRVEKAST